MRDGRGRRCRLREEEREEGAGAAATAAPDSPPPVGSPPGQQAAHPLPAGALSPSLPPLPGRASERGPNGGDEEGRVRAPSLCVRVGGGGAMAVACPAAPRHHGGLEGLLLQGRGRPPGRVEVLERSILGAVA